LDSKVISDKFADLATTVVVSPLALKSKIKKLGARVKVVVCPLLKKRNSSPNGLDLRWLMKYLGAKKITSLLVEGGGEVNASFIETKLAHRVAFFYAPKILGGRDAKKAVAGEGIRSIHDMILLDGVEWKKFDEDLFLTARILPPHHGSKSV
jgi:diaminohydroxyphosphoribosylaminopyrimidine deaminase/5-amino-6-(5-phosphoribosylamino)uracil reductase